MNKKQPVLLVLVGPTAVGKTAMAIRLAQWLRTEIVSADSRQVYAELSIGTAKPTPAELAEVPHHLVGHLSVQDPYNAGQFETEALAVLEKLFEKHPVVVLTGGSGLFVNAVCEGFDAIPSVPQSLRDELNNRYNQEGIGPLQKLLLELDPVYYQTVDLFNVQRIIRALEVCLHTGEAFSSFRRSKTRERPFKIVKIGLTTEREALYQNINQRVDNMMDLGLLEEAKAQQANKQLNALQTVGYSELFDYFEGKYTLEQAVEKIKQHTRNYAKRQLTWFKKDASTTWFTKNEWDKMIRFVE